MTVTTVSAITALEIACLLGLVALMCLLGAAAMGMAFMVRRRDTREAGSGEMRSLEELWQGLVRAERRIERLEEVLTRRMGGPAEGS